MAPNHLIFNPRSVARALGMAAFFLVIANITGQLFRIFSGHGNLHGLIPLFDINKEYNFPTFFAMFLLLSASALLTIITILEKKRSLSYVSHWATLALGFLYLSMDETLAFHESLALPIRGFFGPQQAGVFYFAWVIPGIIVVIFLALYFNKFLLHLPTSTRRTFMLSGVIYLAGAIGMELIGGHYAELHGELDLTYLTYVTIEESLEMAGVIIFIRGLLEYIADNYPKIQFQIDKS